MECVYPRARAGLYTDTLHMAIFIDARKAYEIYSFNRIFYITGSTRLRWVGGRLLNAERKEERVQVSAGGYGDKGKTSL